MCPAMSVALSPRELRRVTELTEPESIGCRACPPNAQCVFWPSLILEVGDKIQPMFNRPQATSDSGMVERSVQQVASVAGTADLQHSSELLLL